MHIYFGSPAVPAAYKTTGGEPPWEESSPTIPDLKGGEPPWEESSPTIPDLKMIDR